MTNAIANAHICLLNGFMRFTLLSIRAVAELSPEAIKRLEDSRNGWQSLRDRHFDTLLLMTKMVAVGVILEGPELVYELSNVIKRWIKKPIEDHAPAWITLIGLVGWIAVSIGVAGEFWVDSKVNSADHNIQAINEELLQDASSSAVTAANAAKSAQGSADDAGAVSKKAETTAGNAMKLASGARTEADSFERDIVSAKQQAANAERDLADALKQAAEARQALNRIKTPRSLANDLDMISMLSAFKGTKYVFVGVGSNEQSVILLQAIDEVLHKSGWERDKSVSGFPAINPYGKDQLDFSVPVTLITGIQISVESPESITNLQPRAIKDLPEYIQAAVALRSNLAAHIIPSSEHAVDDKVRVGTGSSATVRIDVGDKPLE